MKVIYLGMLQWATVKYRAWLSIMDHNSRALGNLRHNALGFRCPDAMKDEHASGLSRNWIQNSPLICTYCQPQDKNRICPLCNYVVYSTYHILVSTYINKWVFGDRGQFLTCYQGNKFFQHTRSQGECIHHRSDDELTTLFRGMYIAWCWCQE